jgi:hypothetical protein
MIHRAATGGIALQAIRLKADGALSAMYHPPLPIRRL